MRPLLACTSHAVADDLGGVLTRHVDQHDEPGLTLHQVAMADWFPRPMIKSPSQWPASTRSATEAGRWSIMVMFVILPRRCRPWVRRRRRRRWLRNECFAGLVSAVSGS